MLYLNHKGVIYWSLSSNSYGNTCCCFELELARKKLWQFLILPYPDAWAPAVVALIDWFLLLESKQLPQYGICVSRTYIFVLPWTEAWAPAGWQLAILHHWGNTCYCLELMLECGQLWQYLLLNFSLSVSNVAIPFSDLNCCLSSNSCDNLCFWQQCGNTRFYLELLLECHQLWQSLLLSWSLSVSNVATPVRLLMPWTIAYAPAVVTISASTWSLSASNVATPVSAWTVAWVAAVVTISASDLKFECQQCGNTCFWLELLLECQQLWQYLLLTWSLSASNVAVPVSALNYWLSASSCDNIFFWPEAWVPAMWQYLFLPWTVAWVRAVVTISASGLKLECQQCGITWLLTWSLSASNVATPVSALKWCLSANRCDNICFWPEAWVPAMWQYLILTWSLIASNVAKYLFLPWTVAWVRAAPWRRPPRRPWEPSRSSGPSPCSPSRRKYNETNYVGIQVKEV